MTSNEELKKEISEVKKDVRENRERSIRMDENIIHIKETLSNLPCLNHNDRLTNLEHFKTKIIVWAGVISAVISIAGKALWNKLTGG